MGLENILPGSSGNGTDELEKLWNSTEAAADNVPIPAGEYTCRLVSGVRDKSPANGNERYTMTFEVLEGEHAGRRFWHPCWLTPAALPMTKRDVAKIGITSLEQLSQPVPKWIRCHCVVVLRRDDNGNERNRLKSFTVLGIDRPEADPFAPSQAVAPAPVVAPATMPTGSSIAPPPQSSQAGGVDGIPF